MCSHTLWILLVNDGNIESRRERKKLCRHEQMCMFQLTVHLFNINVTISCNYTLVCRRYEWAQKTTTTTFESNIFTVTHIISIHFISFVLCTMFRFDDLLTRRLLIARFSRENAFLENRYKSVTMLYGDDIRRSGFDDLKHQRM